MSFDTERFIAEIQNRPCLWDTASKDYCDRNLKIKCWYEIVNLFKEKDEVTSQEIKELAVSLQKRWKSIRGCYTREINRQKAVKSGFVCGSRKSEYIYFKQLQFLKKVVAIRETDSVAATAGPDAATADPEVELQKDRQVDGWKRQKTIDKSEDDKIAVINKSFESSDINNQDDDRLFLLSLVKTLNKVPPHRKLATRTKIMSILEEETTVNDDNSLHFWSQPLESPIRCYGYSTGRGGSDISPELAESSASSHDLPSCSDRHGKSIRRGAPEVPHTIDYVVESPFSPTTISDDSS